MAAGPATPDLADLQGLLAFRRPAPYWGTFFMLGLGGAGQGSELLRRLLPLVQSAAVAAGRSDDANVAVALTCTGLAALGVPGADLATFPVQFRDGMAARAGLLGDTGDSAPARWDRPFGTGEVHLMVSVVAGTEAAWRTAAAELTGMFGRTGGIVLQQGDVAALPGTRTTFGYRDGISHPHVAGFPVSAVTTPEPPLAAGEFVLGLPAESGAPLAMPAPPELTRHGTYLGFRKLHTRVAAFRRFLTANAPDEQAEELLAAKLMGRWRSGAPLALAPTADDPSLAADLSRVNRFGYADDPRGMKCPVGAHVRRVNPRDSALPVMTDPRIHQMIRFGAVYGPPLPAGVSVDDGAERGIYLMFLAARPGTFEFVKREWQAQGGFNGLGDEMDPIAGPHGADSLFTIPQRPVRRRVGPLERFTVTKGGEYGFLPSISALRWLSEERRGRGE